MSQRLDPSTFGPEILDLLGKEGHGLDDWRVILHDDPLRFEESPEVVRDYARTFVGKLSELHVQKEQQLPDSVVCAVHGPWGSGKTSLMHAFKAVIDESRAVTLMFEPWRYENEQQLIVPLIAELSANLQELAASQPNSASVHQDIAEKSSELLGLLVREGLRATGKLAESFIKAQSGLEVDLDKLGPKVLRLFTGPSVAPKSNFEKLVSRILSWFGISPKNDVPNVSETESFKQTLRSLVGTAGRLVANARNELTNPPAEPPPPIVIFVDDLDRCSHDQVRRLLEAIKLFLLTPGIVFVFALDEQQVLRALGEPYLRMLGQEEKNEWRAYGLANRYLEKFFQIKIHLSDEFSPLRRSVGTLKHTLWHHICLELLNMAHEDTKTFRDRNEIVPEFEYDKLWELKDIFFSVKGNPRARKGAARQLYFNYPRNKDPATRQTALAGLVRTFAEEAFQVNFGYVWVNELQTTTPEARDNCFRACFELMQPNYADLDIREGDLKAKVRTQEVSAGEAEAATFEMKRIAATTLFNELTGIKTLVELLNSPQEERNGTSEGEADEEIADRLHRGFPSSHFVLTSYPKLIGEIDKMARRDEHDALRDLWILVSYLGGPGADEDEAESEVHEPSSTQEGEPVQSPDRSS